jgi:hypothetical protein
VSLVYPQLASGAVAHFPLVRRRTRRIAGNELNDGSRVFWNDTGADRRAWLLRYSGLSDADCKMLADFFDSTAGALRSFTFVDPTANLLAWSADPSKSIWNADPMLQIGAGSDAPIGGGQSIRIINAGQAAQRLSQTLAAPAWFAYAFTLYARADVPSSMRLARSTAGASALTAQTVGSAWDRVSAMGSLNTTAVSIDFGIELDPGAAVEVCAIQVEAQPNGSAYKRTEDRNGVYSARFDQDALEITAEGPDQNSLSLQIVTAPGD